MEELCSTMLDAHVWDSQQNLDFLMADLIHLERFLLHNDSLFDIAQKKRRIAYYVRLLFFLYHNGCKNVFCSATISMFQKTWPNCWIWLSRPTMTFFSAHLHTCFINGALVKFVESVIFKKSDLESG